MPKLAQTASVSADSRAVDILQLIADYQRAAKVVVGSLKRQFGVVNLIRGWRSGKIPKTGSLKQLKGKFAFHGVGCLFEVAKRKVNVDFGPNGRCDGFDVWRLKQYASSAFEWLDISAEQIETGLRDLEIAGLIKSPNWQPSPHLYYFTEDLDENPSAESPRPKRGKAVI